MREPDPPTPVDPLFRQQAIEEYLRGRDHGRLLRVSALWKHFAFGVLILAFASATGFAAWVPVGIEVVGQAILRPDALDLNTLSVVCLIPAERIADIQAGQSAVVEWEGASRERSRLVLGSPFPGRYGPDRARAWLGPTIGDIPSITGSVTIVPASPLQPIAPDLRVWSAGRSGIVRIRVGERTLLQALLLQGSPR